MVSAKELREDLLIVQRQLNSLNKSLRTLKEQKSKLEAKQALLQELLQDLKDYEVVKNDGF